MNKLIDYISSLSNVDLLPGFIWFAIVFLMVCIGEIFLNFSNMFLQKAFLYRKRRKLLSHMTEEEARDFLKLFYGDKYNK